MYELNFPRYDFRIKSRQNKLYLFDLIRKKFVHLSPEEWVRQHAIRYLHEELGYPLSLINIEKEIKLNQTKKRYDIVIFRPDGSITLIVECKAPQVKITQKSFDQIARYNLKLNATYLMLTNGHEHYYCRLDYERETYHFLQTLPTYKSK